MSLIVDAGCVVTLHDRRDPRQPAVHELLRREPGDLVLPAPVTAEIDYLLRKRGGRETQLLFLEDLAAGRYRVECLEAQDYSALVQLELRYADINPGLADLSIVVLAHRLGTTRVATFDERHFRAMQPLGGGSFTLLPANGRAA